MTKTFIGSVLVAGLVIISSAAVFGQKAAPGAEYDKNIELMRKDLRSDKKQFVALNLPLTETEATKFWPLYDKYTAEQAAIYDKRLGLIKEYAAAINNMSDATANGLNKRSTEVDQEFVTLRLKYIPLIEKVLPGKKSALFFQLDRRLALLIDLQIASEVPLLIQ